jgi:hypothetical protein
MVLNDRGKWVPIGEKLRKEKSFLHHLEQGEILIEGKWRKLSEVPRPDAELDETKDVKHAAPSMPPEPKTEHPVPQQRETPEETVSFSTDTLRDFSLASTPREEPQKPAEPLQAAPEDDFAPETKIIIVDRPHQQTVPKQPPAPAPAPSHDRVHLSETVADLSVSAETKAYIVPNKPTPSEILQKRVNPETEYLETVLYNTRMLKKADTENSAVPLPVAPSKPTLLRPVSFGIPDEDEHLMKKRSIPFWVFMLLGAAGIAVIAFLWMYM